MVLAFVATRPGTETIRCNSVEIGQPILARGFPAENVLPWKRGGRVEVIVSNPNHN